MILSLVMWLALAISLVGCSTSTSTPEVEKIYFHHADQPPKPIPQPTHWVHTVDIIETFDRCVDDKTGRVIMETMHETDNPADPFGIYENGASYGEFMTKQQAIVAVVRKHPECEVKP